CTLLIFFVVFFFSSRRRHTRFSRDWSSDVCSSDLEILNIPIFVQPKHQSSLFVKDFLGLLLFLGRRRRRRLVAQVVLGRRGPQRSEERRVGKECRPRGAPYRKQPWRTTV